MSIFFLYHKQNLAIFFNIYSSYYPLFSLAGMTKLKDKTDLIRGGSIGGQCPPFKFFVYSYVTFTLNNMKISFIDV